MFSTTLRRWLKKAFVTGRRPPAARRPSFTPWLLTLEDRTLPSTFLVTNLADSGPGSLRQAILDANASPGTDTIAFNIPGGGVHTITPLSALPFLTDPVMIDGYTQPGTRPNTLADGTNAVLLVELDGSAAGLTTNGLNVFTDNSVIRGLVINRFFDAVRLSGSGNALEGNFLGTDVTGTLPLGNRGYGVEITGVAPSNRVGTNGDGVDDAAERNLISGNGIQAPLAAGVWIHGAEAAGNVVAGNLIGTNAAGDAALGNLGQGVRINGAAPNNTVGGLVRADRNVISGNHEQGVVINGFANGNLVAGNYIGVTADGTAALGNTQGVGISGGASQNTVGGSTAAAGNVISGGREHGVIIANDAGEEVVGNAVLGNYIGTDASGTVALGNTLNGVRIDNARDTVVGGAIPGARNVISGNRTNGVRITGPSATGTLVQGNAIGTDVTGTRPLGNQQAGVLLEDTAADSISQNLIAFNGGPGLSLVNASGISAQINLVYFNGGDGISLVNADQNDISLNFIGFGGGDGLSLVNASDNTTRGNAIYGNSGDGIRLANVVNNTIHGNLSAANGLDGFHVDALSADNTLEQNVMLGNGEYDCRDDSEGAGTAGTANTWRRNWGQTENRPGLCAPGS